jgi:hypothetical protein
MKRGNDRRRGVYWNEGSGRMIVIIPPWLTYGGLGLDVIYHTGRVPTRIV